MSVLTICVITSLSAQQKRTIGSVERLLPEMDQYVPIGAEIETVSYTHLTLPTNREV